MAMFRHYGTEDLSCYLSVLLWGVLSGCGLFFLEIPENAVTDVLIWIALTAYVISGLEIFKAIVCAEKIRNCCRTSRSPVGSVDTVIFNLKLAFAEGAVYLSFCVMGISDFMAAPAALAASCTGIAGLLSLSRQVHVTGKRLRITCENLK